MKKAGLIFTLLLAYLFGFSQSKEPKVGLVLSGGGAKGLAHIGVIRVLESQGIYPDYITGTSMGAVVGALYAIGYSPDEMEAIIDNVEWSSLLTNSTPLNEITIEEKEYYGRYLAEVGFERGKISLPKGLIEGQKLNELFSKLTQSVHHIHDFSKFPIPFSCVASDISTGEKVVLNSGFLPEAMRASMAIPSIFTPVEINNRLLVDGGLVRNFPVDEVLDMGADIVIGVFVSSDLSPKEKLGNMVDILNQSAFIFSAFDTREQIKKVDFLIKPKLSGYYTQSFEKDAEIIAAGEQSALELADSIQSFKKKFLKDKVMTAPKQLPTIESYEIQSIKVEGNKTVKSEYILGKLKIEPDNALSIEEIEQRITLLYGTRYFSKIAYELDSNRLVVKVKENPQSTLKMALHYDSENKSGINFNVTFRNILLKNSRLLGEVDLAESPRVDFNYFKYLGVKQKIALNAGFRWAQLPLPLYETDGTQRALYNTSYYNYYLQLQNTNHQNFTFGIRYLNENSRLRPEVADAQLAVVEKITLRNHAIELFQNRNTLNRRFYPTSGSTLNFNLKYEYGIDNTVDARDSVDVSSTITLNNDSYYQMKIDYGKFLQLNEKSVLYFQSQLTLSDLKLNTFNLTDYQFIGGFNPRYVHSTAYLGASENEYYATSFALLSVMYQYELFKEVYVQGIVNYIEAEYPMEFLPVDFDISTFGDQKRRLGLGLTAGYNSILGPIMLGVAKDVDRSNWQTFLNIGFWF